MSKLMSVLLAGFFAAGAIAQTATITPPSGAVAGSASGSTSLSGSSSSATTSNTNTNNNTSLNANSNTNTNTNNVNVYGPGSNKLARRDPAGVSMMPGKDHARTTAPTTAPTGSTHAGTGTTHASATPGIAGKAGTRHRCPPGLEKKDNGCRPPGHAKTASNTSTLGNAAAPDGAIHRKGTTGTPK